MSIQQKQAHQSHEAIVFFRDGVVSKEMLYTEFEALLDCVVPMREFAGRAMEAAYVKLDGSLAMTAAVLFLVPFDADGFPDQRWNVPLRQLAETAARGPDLGKGPIRLAARSQCPISGQEDNLWDIQFGVSGNSLDQLQDRLSINRLGLDTDDAAPPAPPMMQGWQGQPQQQAWQPQPQWQQPPPGYQPSPQGMDSSDAMIAVMQQNSQQMAQLREQHQRETMALQQRMMQAQEQIAILGNEKLLLAEQLGTQAQELANEHERGERRVQQVLDKARAQLAALRAELERERAAASADRDTILAEHEQQASAERERLLAELNAAQAAHASELHDAVSRLQDEHAATMAAVRAEFQEMIERMKHDRDESLIAADLKLRESTHAAEQARQQLEEQLQKLTAELTELRRDKLRLMGEGMDKFFEALREKGVKFVSFQPGAGHLTIAMDDLQAFIDDSESYVARKCGVSVENYRRWLAHYTNPVCQGSAGSGGLCAKPLTKVLKPAEFVGGMHDRCDIHKQVPRSRMAGQA